MSECMTFPDTVEEFMDSYKIVDTEQVYTNGTEMVPIYRMRQWFEHEPEIVMCKDCRKHNVSSGYKNDCCPLYEWRVVSYGHEHDYQYCCFAERRTDDL